MRKRIVQLVRRSLARLGFDIVRLPTIHDAAHHEPVRPYATYAPWKGDPDFQNAYGRINQSTLVDIYRLYELWSLLEQVKDLSGAIIEVGVWRGGSGALLAWRSKSLGLDADIYLCDTFEGVVKAGDRDPHYVGGEHSDVDFTAVQSLVSSISPRCRILRGIFPDETGDGLRDQEIRFVHIDVDVYQSAKDVMTFVWPRLVVGGIVVFDDYGTPFTDGVRQLADELAESLDCVFVHNLNGHGILIKSSPRAEAGMRAGSSFVEQQLEPVRS